MYLIEFLMDLKMNDEKSRASLSLPLPLSIPTRIINMVYRQYTH